MGGQRTSEPLSVRHRHAHRKNRYGITRLEYEAMLRHQGGVCAICGEAPGTRSLHTDHDHATGEVRGLLCGGCNVGLGNFRDNPEFLFLASLYLTSYSK